MLCGAVQEFDVDDNMSLDHDEFRMFTLYAIDKQMESRHARARACTHAPHRAAHRLHGPSGALARGCA